MSKREFGIGIVSDIPRSRGEVYLQRNRLARRSTAANLRPDRSYKEKWAKGTYNSPITSYDARFAGVLGGEPIVDLLKGVDVPVVIDLMAPTGTLVSLFRKLPQKEKYGIAYSLADNRTARQKKRDKALGIMLLTGDLNDPREWVRLQREVSAFTHNRKAHVIMASPVVGLEDVTHHEYFYGFTLRILWEMLSNKGGNLLTETLTPEGFQQIGLPSMGVFKEMFQLYGIETYSDTEDHRTGSNKLRLVRHKGIALDGALQAIDDRILANGK